MTLSGSIMRFDHASDHKIAVLTQVARAKTEQLAATAQGLTASEEQENQARTQLIGVYASTSWRATSRLRGLSRALRSPFSHKSAAARGNHYAQETRPIGLIYFDFTDLVINLVRQKHCNGIQRVQIQLARELVKSHSKVRVFSQHDGTWHDLTGLLKQARSQIEEIVRQLIDLFGPEPAQQFSFNGNHPTRCNIPPQLTSTDTLFVSGVFWERESIIEFYEHAAARGVMLICFYHDFIPLMHPEFTGHNFAEVYRRLLRLPAHVIVTTPFNRAELEASLGFLEPDTGPLSINIVPLAHEFPDVRRNERSSDSLQKVMNRIGHKNFVLYVSTVEIRKNHLMLFAVWDELMLELGERLPQLVVAGKRGWKADAAIARLDEPANEKNRITFIESPSDSELRSLYANCLFTVFPSYFEGWGLPVGESLWFGKACSASNTCSIPAIGGDLCVYFSPDRPEEMKAAIRNLMEPKIRAKFEAKIRAARLRKWLHVSQDLLDLNAQLRGNESWLDASFRRIRRAYRKLSRQSLIDENDLTL